MQGNPYSRLIQLMQKHGAAYNPPCLELGAVISVSPLIVKIGDLQLDKDNLLIAESLLDNIKDFSTTANIKANLTGNLGTTTDAGAHSHNITGLNQVTTTNTGTHSHTLTNYSTVQTTNTSDIIKNLDVVTTNTVQDNSHKLDNYSNVKTDEAANHSHNISNLSLDNDVEISGEIQFKSNLNVGDMLAVIAVEDRQTYIILSKVVSLS